MKKKQEKLLALSKQHKDALVKIAHSREFAALKQLFMIEEHNIIVQSFKVNSSDPALREKKAWHEGRDYELRKIIKTFEEVSKE